MPDRLINWRLGALGCIAHASGFPGHRVEGTLVHGDPSAVTTWGVGDLTRVQSRQLLGKTDEASANASGYRSPEQLASALVTAATIVTGLLVQLWDLHGFTWHTYFGYALIVAVVIHLLLNFRQLFAYTGFRVRRGTAFDSRRSRPAPPAPVRQPAGLGATTKKVLLSRRGVWSA